MCTYMFACTCTCTYVRQEGVEALRRQGSDESIEVYAPSPPRAQGNNNNNNNHGNYDRDRDMFRDDISVRSDYDNNYNNRKQSVNPPPRAHVPSYHQEVVNQRQQHNQNAGAFRDEMRARDVDLRQGYGNGRAGGGNGYGNANGNGNVNDRHADELRQIYLVGNFCLLFCNEYVLSLFVVGVCAERYLSCSKDYFFH